MHHFLVLTYVDFYTNIISDFAVLVGLYFIKILSIYTIYSTNQQKESLYKLFHHSKSPLSSLIDKGLHICIKTFTNKNSLVVTNNNFRHLTAIVLEKYTYNIVTVIA